MPSTSKKQHNLMEAVAHNPAFAKKVGIKQSVGQDFANADKGKKFKQGGNMKTKKMAMGGMGSVKTGAPNKDGIAEKGKTRGTQIKMAGNSVGNGPLVNTMKKGGMAKKKMK